jgi:hypothetical protein
MSMRIDVDVFPDDFKRITRDQRRDIKRGITRGLGQAALKGKDIIDTRTGEGRGFKGKFAPYPEKYIKSLKRAGYPTFPVDLENEGDMLRSMQAKVTKSDEAMLFFDSAKEAKKAAFNNRTRPFFGFNRKEEREIGDVFRKQLRL